MEALDEEGGEQGCGGEDEEEQGDEANGVDDGVVIGVWGVVEEGVVGYAHAGDVGEVDLDPAALKGGGEDVEGGEGEAEKGACGELGGGGEEGAEAAALAVEEGDVEDGKESEGVAAHDGGGGVGEPEEGDNEGEAGDVWEVDVGC